MLSYFGRINGDQADPPVEAHNGPEDLGLFATSDKMLSLRVFPLGLNRLKI